MIVESKSDNQVYMLTPCCIIDFFFIDRKKKIKSFKQAELEPTSSSLNFYASHTYNPSSSLFKVNLKIERVSTKCSRFICWCNNPILNEFIITWLHLIFVGLTLRISILIWTEIWIWRCSSWFCRVHNFHLRWVSINSNWEASRQN